jgi:small subunit ribosomal protein S2
MGTIDKMTTDGTWENINKKERLLISREREKLEKTLGSVSDLSRLPAALFIVDISKEHIAVAEARRLNIPTFAIVDTNSNPNIVDYAIPANDDASKSVHVIMESVVKAIQEGLSERKVDKDKDDEAAEKEQSDNTVPAEAGAGEESGERRGRRTRKSN